MRKKEEEDLKASFEQEKHAREQERAEQRRVAMRSQISSRLLKVVVAEMACVEAFGLKRLDQENWSDHSVFSCYCFFSWDICRPRLANLVAAVAF